jgi:hypothetical protein
VKTILLRRMSCTQYQLDSTFVARLWPACVFVVCVCVEQCMLLGRSIPSRPEVQKSSSTIDFLRHHQKAPKLPIFAKNFKSGSFKKRTDILMATSRYLDPFINKAPNSNLRHSERYFVAFCRRLWLSFSVMVLSCISRFCL